MKETWNWLFVTWAKEFEFNDKQIRKMMNLVKAIKIYEILSPNETAWLFVDPWEFKDWFDRRVL